MLCIIIYAAGEYPTYIKTGASSYWIGKSLHVARLDDLLLDFELNEIIAVIDHKYTLWLNPTWTNAPFTQNELFSQYPPHPQGVKSDAGSSRKHEYRSTATAKRAEKKYPTTTLRKTKNTGR